jgi:transcriptional regulator with XRE-family HTH domain
MKAARTPRPPDKALSGPVPNLLRIQLGAALQRQRMAAGLTQAELATRAGLSLKYVGEIERGEANTTMDVIERVARVVNWDPMTAFEGLREPISEGVRVMLIELLQDVVKSLQQAIRWLQALDPRHNTLAGDDVVVTVVPAVHGHTNKPRGFARRLLGRKS